MAELKSKSKSRPESVAQYCLRCSGDDFQDVKNCDLKTCRLYPYRRGDAQDGNRIKHAIFSFCLSCRDFRTNEVINCIFRECPLYEFRHRHKNE